MTSQTEWNHHFEMEIWSLLLTKQNLEDTWEIFKYGSTYLFAMSSLFRLVTDLEDFNLTREEHSYIIIKWCEVFGRTTYFILPYDLQLMIDHQHNLPKIGEFEEINPEQYSNFVLKFDSKTIMFPYNKNQNHCVIYIVMNHHY